AHVTVDAERAGFALPMVMMGRRIEHVLRVAARAERVALSDEARGMRPMAVAANDAGAVHRALHERAVDERLAEDLAVRVVEPFIETRGNEAVEERLARRERVVELRAARVALRAHVDLACARSGSGARRGRRFSAPPPCALYRRESRSDLRRPDGVQ